MNIELAAPFTINIYINFSKKGRWMSNNCHTEGLLGGSTEQVGTMAEEKDLAPVNGASHPQVTHLLDPAMISGD